MHFSIPTIAAFVGLALAAPANPGFVHVPLSFPKREESLNNPLKAPGNITVELIASAVAYETNLLIGGQRNSVILDTGSPFLWVWDMNSDFCKGPETLLYCAFDGSYQPRSSSTGKNTGKHFKIEYGLGSASGPIYTDTVQMGSATLTDFPFGVNDGKFANNSIPVFGIGPSPQANTSFSAQLVQQGLTKRNAYGLSLGPVDNSEFSEVTFGAVNTGRFDGKLKTLPIDDDPYHYKLKASGSVNGESFLDNGDVILDSGTSLTYLNEDAYSKFSAAIAKAGIKFGTDQGLPTFKCADGDKIAFELDFAGQKIKASGADLGIPLQLLDFTSTDNSSCVFGVLPGGKDIRGLNLFGDTFLRNVYAVYDLDRKQVSIAQAVRGKPDHYVVIDGAVPDSE
ncbi:Acid extracellular protease [Yarrowia sp. B02]|nr:Acid extracellular protease [Yarrowia sp. B02]